MTMSKRTLYACVTLVLTASSLWAAAATQARSTKPAPGRLVSAPPEAQPAHAVRYESRGRRDPFLNPLLIRKRSDAPDEEVAPASAPAGIGGMSVTSVTLQGVSSRESGRLAVFRGTDGRAYFLQAGDKFLDGYLKSVNEDSVVLVRERRYKSGKMLSDELTKRLRTP